MKNILFFSDLIKPITQSTKPSFIIIGRFFKILFRRKRNIKLLQFSYSRNYQFDSSYLIIRYRFRNALWYNFKNIKKTTGDEIIILNLKNISVVPIELIVYGFFRKKMIKIFIFPQQKLESNHFKVTINGITDFVIKQKSTVFKKVKPEPVFSKIEVARPGLKIMLAKTQLKQSSYHQTDFI